MQTSRFEIVIVGNSAAARMAAALLAKHGKRLLLLSTPTHQDSWLCSSLFVEKLLATLGGQSCFTSCQAFQVISQRARITVHPDLPLADELQREFGSTAETVGQLLKELEDLGIRLEELLWEHGGLPGRGVGETARWRWLCLRRKISATSLATPLAGRLQHADKAATEWLGDLFRGLALQPLESLTIADGALLWAHARRPRGIAADELASLLQKRFEQFHGVEAGLAELASLEHRDGRWVGNQSNGSSFQADQLILGDLEQEFPGRRFSLPHQLMTPPQQLVTSALTGQLSSLLESRVIAGGPSPLRMIVSPAATGSIARIGAGVLANEENIRQQLEKVLPFASYTLHVLATGCNTVRLTAPCTSTSSLFSLPIQLGGQLWCADETHLLPQHGLGGAAMLAWTLARHLAPSAFPRVS